MASTSPLLEGSTSADAAMSSCSLDDSEAAAPLTAPLDGYLVAAVAAPDGFGGFIPEDRGDGPESSDSDDDDEKSRSDLSSFSFHVCTPNRTCTNNEHGGLSTRFFWWQDGKKEVRDSSFRQRDAAKLERSGPAIERGRALTQPRRCRSKIPSPWCAAVALPRLSPRAPTNHQQVTCSVAPDPIMN